MRLPPPCLIQWAICRCRYRGHRYCSEACSELARLKKKRQYNRDHQKGPALETHVEQMIPVTLNEAEQPQGAIEVFEKVLEMNSKSAAAHGGLGTALLLAKEHDEVVRSLEEAVRLDSKRAAARLHLAMAYEQLDRIEDSLREYEAFVRLTDDADMAERVQKLVEQARAALAERQQRE